MSLDLISINNQDKLEKIRYQCAHDAEMAGRVSTVDRGRVLPFLKTSVETELCVKEWFYEFKRQASLFITLYWRLMELLLENLMNSFSHIVLST